jgi:hypothetical protein
MRAIAVVDQDLIEMWVAEQQIAGVGPYHRGYVRIRKRRAQGADERRRDDDIAEAIGAHDEDAAAWLHAPDASGHAVSCRGPEISRAAAPGQPRAGARDRFVRAVRSATFS